VIAFRHPLVRSVVYESAPPGRRQQAHRALAEALDAERYADRALWHRAMAAPIPDERIAAELEASARQSQLRGGHASAATAFERAAELSDADSLRAMRLAAAVEAAWAAGQIERARGLLGRSVALAERPQRARLLYLRGVIEGQSGWLLDGVATLKQAIAISDDPSLKLEMLREACSMANQAGAYDDAIALGLQARIFPARATRTRFTVVTVTALAAELSGDYARGAPWTAEAIDLAQRLDDPQCLIWAAYSTARESTLGAGLPYATRAVDIARERALLTTLPFALQVQGAALIGQSRYDLAYATAEEGWRLAVDVQQPWAAAWNVVNLAVVTAVRGAEAQTREHVAQLRALVAASGASSVGRHVGRALGLLELGLGRPAQALEQQLVMISAARPDSDRIEAVADHLERFEAWVERFPNQVRVALLERCRALVDDAHAEPHFERAL
jgi:tetratricopeptide (TPR) repeat protein